ncbi:MAG: hypothetical protein LIO76_01000, partial [Clostridiales bacterium]|nr:hypothetical protein [Clostridiales bacterium]
GLVKGIKAGSATITCVTKDSSKKATCKITVTNASTLSITNVSAPSGTLAAGSAFTIAGQITSNYTITSITAKVETSSGTSKFSNTVKPNSKSYPVYNLDSKMNFSKLAAGKYVFTITATDLKGTKTLVSKSFTVKAASFTTSGITYPSSISKGKDFTIKGTVKSTSKITNISVSIINTTTGKQMSGGSVNPKATSYNVNKLDSKLNFKSLEKGKYVYRLSATNASGITKYIVTKSFTVK